MVLVTRKEIKESSGKCLCVWAKNQLRFEMFKNMLEFAHENLNGKLF